MSQLFRFIHTADLHLDSPLKSLARRDAALADQVSNASRTAFSRIIDLCLQEQVNALLLAGDIFDSNNPSVATVGFFHREINRLRSANIRVYSIRGNHDHYAKLANSIELPDHMVEFSGNKKFDLWQQHGVTFHGVSFRAEHATESALRAFKVPDERYRNIALLHTSLGGSEGHDVYAPCSVNQLDTMGFDYWALGHIHKRSVNGNHSTVVMPGIPQGRDIGEYGPKSVTLVSMDEQGRCNLSERTVSPVQFEWLKISLNDSDIELIDNAESVLRFLCKEFTASAQHLKHSHPDVDRWIIRLQCIAPTRHLYGLKAELEHTLEALHLAAATLETVHIDKVLFNPSEVSEQSKNADSNFIAQLREIVLSHLEDEHLQKISQQEFDDLVKLIPQKTTRDLLQATPELSAESISNFQRAGVNELLSLVRLDSTKG